ncbi:MAG: hypothetical protein Q9190_004950 [Brigantiaea leucoxantha]
MRALIVGAVSIAAESQSIVPAIYQELVDRGWRSKTHVDYSARSGTLYYKPDCRNSCCPHYTIRLDAKNFQSIKDQRQAVNRWNKYVLGQEYIFKAARLCPKSRVEKKQRKACFNVCEAVHESEYSYVQRPTDRKTKEAIEPAHRYEVNIEPDTFTEEKYALFANYQKYVHREGPPKTSKAGFKRFLCSGLKQSTQERADGVQQRLGSYHQCYRIDGRLVAMGVLDLLPNCVSSVYLIYHEDVNDWNFGKLSALREISLAVEGGYNYYYMGFYIHSCTKMRYKGKYRPSYLLDPETYDWNPFDKDYSTRLSSRKYVSLARERQLGLPAHPLTDVEGLGLGPNQKEVLLRYLEEARPLRIKREASVFEANMPGILSPEEVRRDINLGKWRLKLNDIVVYLEDLVFWERGDIADSSSLKGVIAQLAASLGPSLVQQLVLDIG